MEDTPSTKPIVSGRPNEDAMTFTFADPADVHHWRGVKILKMRKEIKKQTIQTPVAAPSRARLNSNRNRSRVSVTKRPAKPEKP